MYTVVFADDEVELRQAILQRIDWEGLGFSVVADAENGVEALEAVEQHEPDLLITDIRMPLMTGIELARRVREVCPATQIVFLSGYDDFGYAQEAIRYNVISYLLKPISAAELSEELGHIRAKMDARLEELRHAGADPQTEKRLAETEFLLPLLLGTSDDFERDEVLYARAAEIGLFATPPKRFCVAVAKFKGADGQNRTMARHIPLTETILSKYISVCVFLVNGRVVIFAYSDKDNSENFRIAMQDLVQSAAKLYGETCTVGISRLFTSISQSAAAYFEAVTARRYSTVMPAFSASKTVKMRRSLTSHRRSASGASVSGFAFSVSSPISAPRTALRSAASKVGAIAMTSPVAFICVPSLRDAPANLSNGHFGNLTTT